MEPNRIPAKLVVRRSPRAHLASTLLLALPTIAAESTHVCFKKISQRRRSSPLMFMTRADLPIAEHRLKKRTQNSLELFLDRKLIALPKSPHPVSSLWSVSVDSVALVAIFAPDNFSILQKSKLRLIQLTILTKTLVTRCFPALVITGIKPPVFFDWHTFNCQC